MYDFAVHRPKTLREAEALLAKDPEAKLLAGGHSLIPVMKLRLASPSSLIDLSTVEGMTSVKKGDNCVVIGAMTRHADAAGNSILKEMIPGLASVPSSIGDPQVRNRGTIGGSIANNDPNADYPAACLGLGATIVTSRRRIAADEFFTGLFSTSLEDGEIITALEFPVVKQAAYEKFKHPASGFALVGVFVSKQANKVRIGVTGAGANGAFRATEFEKALENQFSPSAIDKLSLPAADMVTDIHGSGEYRAHLVKVMTRRAVAKANEFAR